MLIAEEVNRVSSTVYYSRPMKKGAYRAPWKPLVVPRPGVKPPEPKKIRPSELGKYMGGG